MARAGLRGRAFHNNHHTPKTFARNPTRAPAPMGAGIDARNETSKKLTPPNGRPYSLDRPVFPTSRLESIARTAAVPKNIPDEYGPYADGNNVAYCVYVFFRFLFFSPVLRLGLHPKAKTGVTIIGADIRRVFLDLSVHMTVSGSRRWMAVSARSQFGSGEYASGRRKTRRLYSMGGAFSALYVVIRGFSDMIRHRFGVDVVHDSARKR